METKLEQLLLKKKFSDLSSEEKKYVLSVISEENYVKLHILLINSKEAFKKEYEKIKLNKEIKNDLNLAFRKKFKKQHFSYIQNILPSKNVILKPCLGFSGFILIMTLSYHFYKKNALKNDIKEVTSYLLHENRNKENIHLFYSSDTLKNNIKIADSLKRDYSEMNKYLKAIRPGLNTSFTTSIN